VADVTVWSESVDFQTLGTLFPDALLQQPEKVDFAAMVLGPDDELVTDAGILLAPRDNVVFELGLFMGHLGPQRTFMVVPSGGVQVKILSDLAGMIWAKYRPPARMADAVKKISEGIERNSRRNVLAYDGPPSVHEFKTTLLNEARRLWQRNEHVTVWNFALDMSATWAPMYESLVEPKIRNLTCVQ